ncbi:MAG: cytochrome B5 [Euryarchaeota archaeon]|nr:cytochrome B5 [Euryarchaeota archaeon]
MVSRNNPSDKQFTRQELAVYNGQDGRPSYVAVDGIVYDVSSSVLWFDGAHQGEHTAGDDLTEELEYAPHEKDVLANYPVVGVLRD